MSREITVRTGCRLHFGLLANQPQSGRSFGGAGLMIDSVGSTVVVRQDEADFRIADSSVCRGRVEEFVTAYLQACPEDVRPSGFVVDVEEAVPQHVGLGSGTQLGMAIAQALSLWTRDCAADAPTLGGRVGRGGRSALGIYGFSQGGFLVDGGKLRPAGVAPLVARVDFPANWRIVLATPKEDAGLSGDAEVRAFSQLPPMPVSITAELCRILLMELLPSVVEADFDRCGESLFCFGRTVGEYFRPAQGGVFASRRMEDLCGHLRRLGVRGVGQTSWGPTLFVLCRHDAAAQSLVADLAGESRWKDCVFRIAAPLNGGAKVLTEPG